jgi:membrane fusion protein (multidrug efflux system)
MKTASARNCLIFYLGLVFCLGLCLSSDLVARDYSPLLYGEVFSRTAQKIFVPHSKQHNLNISTLVAEGQEVQVGDVVVQFDGTEFQRQLEQHLEKRRSQEALTDRDLAKLAKELTQARFAVAQAQVAMELAAMKAEIPKGLIGTLEYADNQLSNEKAIKTLENAQKQLAEKVQNLDARQQQGELDRRKADITEAWWQEMLKRMTVLAKQRGFVIHGKHPWTKVKFQEGDSARTNFMVAEVADTSDLVIRVWVNDADRPHIEAGVPVTITLDALPKETLPGRLETISDGAGDEWGKSIYFLGTVGFDAGRIPGLLPGMSALVEFRR